MPHLIAEIIHTILGQFRFINDKCILEVATFDKSDPEERFYLAHEAERSRRSHLNRIIRQVTKRSMLLTQQFGVESDGHIYLIMVAGLDTHRMAMLGDILYRFFNHIDLLLGVLLYQPDSLDGFHKHLRATIQDRHLGCIDINDAVIHTQGIEGRQGMLNRRYFPFTPLEHRASFRSRNIIRQSLMARLSGQIYPSQAQTCVFRRRMESSRDMQACVQADRREGKTIF